MGMQHCTFFHCLMNESNSVPQAQNQPLFLCPVCLRKLHKFLQFEIVLRYEKLKEFLELLCTTIMARKEQSAISYNSEAGAAYWNVHGKPENEMNLACRIDNDLCSFQKFRSSSIWLGKVLSFIG